MGPRCSAKCGAVPGMDSGEIAGRGPMTTLTIFEQVRDICADLFQVPAAQIAMASSPQTLERWDSVQHLNLVLQLEQQFGVPFEPEEMDRMTTIGGVVDLVASKLNN
jgi:acyl carrier protein